MQFQSLIRRGRVLLGVLVSVVVPGATVRAQDSTAHPPAAVRADTIRADTLRAEETPWGNLKPSAEHEVVVLRLRDGTVLVGRIVAVTPASIRFASAVGEIDVPRARIADVKVGSAGQVHEGELWPEDPSATRLFFAPTGRTLAQGEGYFADAYIFLPSFQYGITDRFTIGAGMSIFPGLSIDEQLYYLTPKVNVYSRPDLNVSVGALVAGVKGISSDHTPFGIAYGVSTFGNTESSVSLGAGVSYAGSRADNDAVVMAGGSLRTSRNISLLTENYYYTGASAGLISGGLRFMGEILSVDLAGFVPVGTDAGFTLLPYVAFLYHF